MLTEAELKVCLDAPGPVTLQAYNALLPLLSTGSLDWCCMVPMHHWVSQLWYCAASVLCRAPRHRQACRQSLTRSSSRASMPEAHARQAYCCNFDCDSQWTNGVCACVHLFLLLCFHTPEKHPHPVQATGAVC